MNPVTTETDGTVVVDIEETLNAISTPEHTPVNGNGKIAEFTQVDIGTHNTEGNSSCCMFLLKTSALKIRNYIHFINAVFRILV